MWIEIQIGKLNILIGSCYRPPNQPADENHIFLTKLQDSIDTVKLDSYDAVLILGDFNDKCNKWSDNHIVSELDNKLVELSESRNFDQIIKEPTRYNDNTGKSKWRTKKNNQE
jgi:hypothetical protein